MKLSNAFKDTIKAYLDKRALEDELFAVTYKKDNKTLDECCSYVMKCAKDGGAQGYTDDEVFGWAIHYYDEDDIQPGKPFKGQVIVNHHVELSQEEIQKARAKAIEEVVAEEKQRLRKKTTVKKETSENVQAELF